MGMRDLGGRTWHGELHTSAYRKMRTRRSCFAILLYFSMGKMAVHEFLHVRVRGYESRLCVFTTLSYVEQSPSKYFRSVSYPGSNKTVRMPMNLLTHKVMLAFKRSRKATNFCCVIPVAVDDTQMDDRDERT